MAKYNLRHYTAFLVHISSYMVIWVILAKIARFIPHVTFQEVLLPASQSGGIVVK